MAFQWGAGNVVVIVVVVIVVVVVAAALFLLVVCPLVEVGDIGGRQDLQRQGPW